MKTVLLAGRLGTRIGKETHDKTKPTVEIDSWPIIWHIMNHYIHYGYEEFVVALGYRGPVIKDFFLNYHRLNSDLRIDLSNLEKLEAQGELMAYRHSGFLQCMDTLRNRQLAKGLWSGDAPPWQIRTD